MVMSALINVTQQNLFTFLIFQRHLLVLASQIKFVEFLWKTFWKNMVNFPVLYCVLRFVTHVTKSAYFSLSSWYAIFPLLCNSKWGDDIPQWLLSDCQMQTGLRLINFLHYLFHRISGFPANIHVVNGWQSENNRPTVWRTTNLLLS